MRPSLALVRGCRLCGISHVGMLVLESGVMVCRPCAGCVAALLRSATKSFLNRVWDVVDTRQTESSPSRDTDDVFAKFKSGVATVIRPEDFKAHRDLGMAYAAMGLCADALSEFATSLDERAPHDMAQDAFALIFGGPRARPGALDVIAAALATS